MPSRYEESYFTSAGLQPKWIPSEMPPDGCVSSEVLVEINNARLDPLKRRMAAWTMAASAAFEGAGRRVVFPGFRFATFGLADPRAEKEGLAVFMYVDPEAAPAVDKSAPIDELRIGNKESFTVWVRPIEERKHISLWPRILAGAKHWVRPAASHGLYLVAT